MFSLLLLAFAARVTFGQGGVSNEGEWPAQKIKMPVDHFDANNDQTYNNRFWVDDSFYKPGGPVILYDNGEGGVDDTVPIFFNTSQNMVLAERFSGLAIRWEHRYYGDSLPVRLDKYSGIAKAGLSGYKYLTTEQALEDVVYLANHFQPAGLSDSWHLLHPSVTPWIFMGGSYPGVRAAHMRIRNPETIYASWASSAPVQAEVTMPTYWDQLARDMAKNCSADLAAATRYMDQVLTSGSESERLKMKWLLSVAARSGIRSTITDSSESALRDRLQAASDITNFQAARYLQFKGSFQYGLDDDVLPYCQAMQTYNPLSFLNSTSLLETVTDLYGKQDNATKLAPLSSGIAARYGPKAAFAAVLHATALLENKQAARAVPASEYIDSHSWAWQVCSEYGYFMMAHTGSPDSILSKFITLEALEEETCGKEYWGFDGVPKRPNTSIPLKYGGWNMNPSNVMFTDGRKDPWRTLSVHSTSEEFGAPMRRTTQEIPHAGQPVADGEVFGLVFEEAYHASDLGGRDNAVAAGQLFGDALEKWLPCFNKDGCLGGYEH